MGGRRHDLRQLPRKLRMQITELPGTLIEKHKNVLGESVNLGTFGKAVRGGMVTKEIYNKIVAAFGSEDDVEQD